MKKYELTDEHRARLPEWRDRWIANAMSTKPMNDVDRAAMREAVRGLYEAAGLKPPPDERIVFVPSPFVLRFAGGFAAAIWHMRRRKNDGVHEAVKVAKRDAMGDVTLNVVLNAARNATQAATCDAAWDATWDSTRDAALVATGGATCDATWDATAAATEAAADDVTEDAVEATGAAVEVARDATWDAAWNATWAAMEIATRNATWAAIGGATLTAAGDVTEVATRSAMMDATLAVTNVADEGAWYLPGANHWRQIARSIFAESDDMAKFSSRCAAEAWRMWQGGNQWSPYVAFLSFFRHVAKLDIDYSKWHHWEQAAIHGGPRIMHPDFCMISDRPEVLLVDEQNRPHCDTGPFCRWRDGSALFAAHGVRVPAWVLLHPEQITVAAIDAEKNAEVARVMMERYPGGWDAYMRDADATIIDRASERHPLVGVRGAELYRRDRPDGPPIMAVRMVNSTAEPDGSYRRYMLRVHPECRPMVRRGDMVEFGEPQKLTALNAIASTFGMTGAEYERRMIAES